MIWSSVDFIGIVYLIWIWNFVRIDQNCSMSVLNWIDFDCLSVVRVVVASDNDDGENKRLLFEIDLFVAFGTGEQTNDFAYTNWPVTNVANVPTKRVLLIYIFNSKKFDSSKFEIISIVLKCKVWFWMLLGWGISFK